MATGLSWDEAAPKNTVSWEDAAGLGGATAPAKPPPPASSPSIWERIAGPELLNAIDRVGLKTGLIDPATYRGRDPQPNAPTIITNPAPRSSGQQFLDTAGDAMQHFSPAALIARTVAEHTPNAYDFDPNNLYSPEQKAAQRAQRIVDAERDAREQIGLRDAADPALKSGDGLGANIERGAAKLLGGMAGWTLGDPTSVVLPGATWWQKALAAGGIGAGADVGLQSGELAEGTREQYDPLQTAVTAGFGTGTVGLVEGARAGLPALREWWKSRGINTDDVPDDQLVAGSLDGSIGDGSLTPDQVNGILQGAGANPEAFTSPEAALGAVQRIQAAQGRAPANLAEATPPLPPKLTPKALERYRKTLDREIDQDRAEREWQQANPNFSSPEPAARVVPEDVSIIAAPEGAVRADDPGAMAGLARKRAADAGVIEQGRELIDQFPVFGEILSSNVPADVKAGTIWQRMNEIIGQMKREGRAADQEQFEAPPWMQPTPDRAEGAARRAARPNSSLIHDITMSTESGGRRYGADGEILRSPKGAQGEMQVMPGTSRDPGFGVRPAQNDSPEELARVGRDYIDALRQRYGGDMEQAWAAYNAGPGAVDGAVAKYGRDWLAHMPEETRSYVGRNMARLGRIGPDLAAPQQAQFRAADYSMVDNAPGTDFTFDASDANSKLRGNTSFNMGAAEDLSAPTSKTTEELNRPGARGEDMATGAPTRPFKAVADDPFNQPGFWEERSRRMADEATAKAQADLEAEWDRRRAAREERARSRSGKTRFEEQRTNTEQDASQRYGGKYGQRPHKKGDFWQTTDDGFVADTAGQPVAFRNAREAAKWAASNQMGGDFELASWASNSERVVLRRRANSTYGQAAPPPGATEPPPRDFAGSPDYDRSATPDSRGKALESPQSVADGGAGQSASEAPNAAPDRAGAAPDTDFNAGVSSPSTGEPAGARPRPSIPEESRPAVTGEAEQVVTARGRPIDTRFEVREARDLVTSDHPAFDPDLQPRERGTRAASDAQVAEIAGRLDPHQLNSSRLVSQGAPIVGSDRIVESGNGRVAAIRRAYSQHPDLAASYRQMIEGKGFDLSGFDEPVLVRRRTTELSPEDRRAFVREANERDTMSMSSGEQAKIDAGRLNDVALNRYRGGDIHEAGNRDFVRAFLEDVASPSERNAMLGPDGSLSVDGARRIRSALLSKAFDDSHLVQRIVENPDSGIRAIGNVLTEEAPRLAQIKSAVARGELPAEYDITGRIAEAAKLIARARSEGKRVGDLVSQNDVFSGSTDPVTEAVARLMFKDEAMTQPRSAARLSDALRYYTEEAHKVDGSPSLLGDAAPPAKPVDILNAARERAQAKEAANGNGNGNGTLFHRGPEVRRREFIAGVATTAGGFTFGGKTFAKTPQLTGLLSRSVDHPINLGAVLKRIENSTANSDYRVLAARLGKLVADVKVSSEPLAGGVLGLTKFGDDGRPVVALSKPVDMVDYDGWNESTVLHEATHAAILQEYGFLSTRLAGNSQELLHRMGRDLEAAPRPHAQEHLSKLRDLWEEYGRAVDRARENGSLERLDHNGQIENASASPDEMLGYIVEPEVQAFMRQVRGSAPEKSLWDRFVDWVRGLFGMKPTEGAKTLLDDVLDARNGLLDAAIEHPTERIPGKPEGEEQQSLAHKIEPGNEGEARKRLLDMAFHPDAVDDAGKLVGSLTRNFGSPKGAWDSIKTGFRKAASPLIYSNDGRLRAAAKMFNSPTLDAIGDIFHAQGGKDRAVSETYHEAVQRETIQPIQKAFDAVADMLDSPAAMLRIRDMLTSPDKAVRATEAERLAARAWRDILKERLEYRRAAGEDIGSVENYFRRQFSPEKIVKNAEGFKKLAAEEYRKLGSDNPEAAAEAWFKHIFDTYAGVDGGGQFASGIGGGMGASSAKTRVFGPEADRVFKDFLEDDVWHTMTSYLSGAARRAEQTRRFGMKGPVGSEARAAWEREHQGKTQWDVMLDNVRREVIDSGRDASGVMHMVDGVYKANLGQYGALPPQLRATVSGLHAWTQLRTMDRATFSSMGDMMMGFVRGGPRYGFQHLSTGLREFVRHVRRASPSEATRYAEALGVANDAIQSQTLYSRASMDQVGTTAHKIIDRYHRTILLKQWTDGMRIGAMKTGQRFIGDLAHDLESSSPKVRERGAFYLRELGIKDPEAFASRMREGLRDVGAPSREAILNARDGSFEREYATALTRYVNQSILMPSRAERPTWASHPVGGLFFSLQSYSAGFKRNVLDRVGRLGAKAVREKDPAYLAPAAGLLGLLGFTYVQEELRRNIFGSNYDFENETPLQFGLRIADRAGFTGQLSPVVNAFEGIKYQRSVAAGLTGPAIGPPLDLVEKGIALKARNSDNTNTAERNFAGAVYDVGIAPAINLFASNMKLGAAGSAIVLGKGKNEKGMLPDVRDSFVDEMAGPKADQ